MTPDEAILALLDSSPALSLFDSVNGDVGVPNSIYDGEVEVNKEAKVISVPLPYLVYFASPGYDRDIRLGGQAGGRVKQFQLTGVGSTREQAEAVLEDARAVISRKRATIDDKTTGLILLRDSTLIRRDDEFTRPDGGSLFYGVEQYEVAV